MNSAAEWFVVYKMEDMAPRAWGPFSETDAFAARNMIWDNPPAGGSVSCDLVRVEAPEFLRESGLI